MAGMLDQEYALVTAARELGLHPFRSEAAWELDRYYVTLVNAFVRGAYSEVNNRAVLTIIYPDDAFRIEDDLYDGNTAVDEYIDALVDALRTTYEAQDSAVLAAMALTEAPIYLVPGSPAAGAKATARPKPTNRRGGIMRGIDV